MSTTGAPSARVDHSAVWTGSRMLVWGGQNYGGYRPKDGGSYDPETNSWVPIPADGAPSGREGFMPIWTGSRLLVVGGIDELDESPRAALYDPETSTWTKAKMVGSPYEQLDHFLPFAAMWTGCTAIYWSAYGGWAYEPPP